MNGWIISTTQGKWVCVYVEWVSSAKHNPAGTGRGWGIGMYCGEENQFDPNLLYVELFLWFLIIFFYYIDTAYSIKIVCTVCTVGTVRTVSSFLFFSAETSSCRRNESCGIPRQAKESRTMIQRRFRRRMDWCRCQCPSDKERVVCCFILCT